MASLFRKNGYHIRLIDCLNASHPELRGHKAVKLPRRYPSGHGKFPKERIPKPQSLGAIKRHYHRYGITPAILHGELLSCDVPDLILVTSVMTYWYPGIFEVIRTVREAFPTVPVVLGGIYATLCYRHAQRSGADLVLTGEGERHFETILRDFFSEDAVCVPDPADLDSFPYPALDLLPLKDQFPILTSRGCPNRCVYCASRLLAGNFRQRDPIKVADEIEFWQENFGINHFSIYDDAFLINPDALAIPLLREITKRKLQCQFHCPNGLHLSQITEELSKLMYDAGFATIRFGFESSDPVTQLSTGGKVNNEQFDAAIRYLKEAGYRSEDIGVYLLCGLPRQEAEEVRESIRYVQSRGARPIIAEYSPIPGTALWKSAVDASGLDLEGEPLFHNNTLLPCGSEKLSQDMYKHLKMLTRSR